MIRNKPPLVPVPSPPAKPAFDWSKLQTCSGCYYKIPDAEAPPELGQSVCIYGPLGVTVIIGQRPNLTGGMDYVPVSKVGSYPPVMDKTFACHAYTVTGPNGLTRSEEQQSEN